MVNEDKKKWGEDVFPLISWFKADKVRAAKVLVVGAGALGNEVLKNLALFGVGNIVVVDFDKIEYSNLTRSILFREEDADKGFYKSEIAAKRVREINPHINVKAICGNLATDVGLGIFRQVDVVIACLDNLLARVLLNRLSFRAGKVWIDGGIGDLEGQLNVYKLHHNCYECSLSEEEELDMKAKMSCAGITRENESHGRVATTPVIASIIGAVQVQEAMKIIHYEDIEKGVFTPLIGKMFNYEGMHPYVGIYDFSAYKEDCFSHEYWENIVEIQDLSAHTKIDDTLQLIKKSLNVDKVEINMLNDKFVDKIVSRSNNKKYYPMLPDSKIPAYIQQSDELRALSFADGGLYQNSFENIDEEFPYKQMTLNEIGIPILDILQITTEKGYKYVELSADRTQFDFLYHSKK